MVKWYDSRAVLLASSFSSVQPIGKIKRFDRTVRAKIDIDCPSMVVVYNKFMGGIDLLDALTALYRISIRSKKCYMRLFFHFIDMATVTSWLLYRRDCMFFGVPKKNQLPLFSFKASIAEALCKENKGNNLSKGKGRPSSGVDSQFEKKKKTGHATMPIPQKNVRMDQVGHWPIVSEKEADANCPTVRVVLQSCVKNAMSIYALKNRGTALCNFMLSKRDLKCKRNLVCNHTEMPNVTHL